MSNNNDRQYWTYAPGEKKGKQDAWCWENTDEAPSGAKGDFALGVMGMGFLNDKEYNFDNKDEIYQKLKEETNLKNPRKTSNFIWDFYKNAKKDDIVFVRNGTKKLLAYGIVLSDYYYAEKRNKHKHVRDVKWQKLSKNDEGINVDVNLGRVTFSKAIKHLEYLKEMCGLNVQSEEDLVKKHERLNEENIDKNNVSEESKNEINYGNGGESEEHKKLKEYILNNPSIIGLEGKLKRKQNEERLPSGDSLDVYFEYDNKQVSVEVKTSKSQYLDIKRGLYQCVKYKAVLEAMAKEKENNIEIESLLVLENELPEGLKKLRDILKIEVKTVKYLV